MFNSPGSDWNQKKIKAIIEHYGHQFFVGKKVLDLGCGHGDIGGVLHRLGADVTVVDARQDHLKMVGKKYAGVKTVKSDLDGAWPFHGKVFDATVDIALLNHLKNFEEHLRSVCASTTFLLLETAVLDSNDPNMVVVHSDAKNADGSFNGFSSQVSADNIERVLKDCGMSFKRYDSPRFNAGTYVYDWQVTNTNHFDSNKRRIWFCVNERRSNTSIDNARMPSPLVIQPREPGTLSPTLTDSKIPIVHQPISVTRSPSVPHQQRNQSITAIAPPRNQRLSVSGKPRVRLFYNHYEDKNPQRRQEIDVCFMKNVENPLFEIIIVGTDEPATFDHMFQAVNRVVTNFDISIICNADMFFDDTIKLATHAQPHQVYALSGWIYLRDNFASFSTDEQLRGAWIVRGPINNVRGNFQMKKPGSAGRIAHEFQESGYTAINPSKSIKAYCIDKTGVPTFPAGDIVPGPYLDPEPIAF